MKKFLKILERKCIFFFALSMSLIFLSCSQENTDQETPKFSTKNIVETKTLTKSTLLGENIYLPAGTEWNYINKEKNEVSFDLPEGYLFLIRENNNGIYRIALGGGGYSCTCSGGGSCTVFYNEKLGYGCLHGSCGDSCTGSPARSGETIVGVLIAANDMLDAKNEYPKASLSQEGKHAFFGLPEVQKEIKRTYNFIYKNLEKPNFKTLNVLKEKAGNKNYHLVKASLYGFELGIVVPNDPTLEEYFPELARAAAPTKCDCSGGGSSCEFDKKCIFGNCVYYCNGCTTCTMN